MASKHKSVSLVIVATLVILTKAKNVMETHMNTVIVVMVNSEDKERARIQVAEYFDLHI